MVGYLSRVRNSIVSTRKIALEWSVGLGPEVRGHPIFSQTKGSVKDVGRVRGRDGVKELFAVRSHGRVRLFQKARGTH
jgi:hypothetical protein